MLTREQWEALARFAGVVVSHVDTPWEQLRADKGYFRLNCDGSRVEWSWKPLTDWNDFGPLWVKLNRWLQNDFSVVHNNVVLFNQALSFEMEILNGAEQDLMQAGCLLGAAIGATMGG